MIDKRLMRRVDLLHWFAATALMLMAVTRADRWFWVVAAFSGYAAVTICEAMLYGALTVRPTDKGGDPS